jgi:hypothetical protein
MVLDRRNNQIKGEMRKNNNTGGVECSQRDGGEDLAKVRSVHIYASLLSPSWPYERVNNQGEAASCCVYIQPHRSIMERTHIQASILWVKRSMHVAHVALAHQHYAMAGVT